MSFSSDIKEELSAAISSGRHCQIAEIAAIISFCGRVHKWEDGRYSILVHTENLSVARKYFTLVKKTFNINTNISVRRNAYLKKGRAYTLSLEGKEEGAKLLQAIKVLNVQGRLGSTALISELVIQQACCKRSFLRGAFLSSGSISDPKKFYHFEIVCTTMEKAEQIQSIMKDFSIEGKIIQRKKYFVVYIKEGSQIVEILNVMEAHVALMNLENVRILKDMRNTVNRKVNCETANINKTVSAALKQIEDIEYLRNTIGFDALSEGLAEIARLRLENPDCTLKELGELLNPRVGKSGVNHRLRKLSDLAEELREIKEEKL